MGVGTEMPSEEDRRKLVRNLALATQTIISCGHARRVTVADMLGDFEGLRTIAGTDPQLQQLYESLVRAVRNDVEQDRKVFEVLGILPAED